jgi:hypothetical protein
VTTLVVRDIQWTSGEASITPHAHDAHVGKVRDGGGASWSEARA